MTDPEVAATIEGYDEMKRELEGEAKAGRPIIGHSVTDCWSLQKTATELNISKPAVVKAIQIAKAIKEYDELKRELEGESKAGGDRQSIYTNCVDASGWTQAKTAEDLGIERRQ